MQFPNLGWTKLDSGEWGGVPAKRAGLVSPNKCNFPLARRRDVDVCEDRGGGFGSPGIDFRSSQSGNYRADGRVV